MLAEVLRLRIALSVVNPVKDCQCGIQRDEEAVSAHILAYQVAFNLLSSTPGQIQVDRNGLTLRLEEYDPLHFDLKSGLLNAQNLNIPLGEGYQGKRGVNEIVKAIKEELNITPTDNFHKVDPLTTLLVKLIEIYHARCGLQIHTIKCEEDNTIWEINLHEGGPRGWVQSDGTIRNRLGEVAQLEQWTHLRPEKMAAYVFGFNRFCKHFPNPLDKEKNK